MPTSCCRLSTRRAGDCNGQVKRCFDTERARSVLKIQRNKSESLLTHTGLTRLGLSNIDHRTTHTTRPRTRHVTGVPKIPNQPPKPRNGTGPRAPRTGPCRPRRGPSILCTHAVWTTAVTNDPSNWQLRIGPVMRQIKSKL